LHPNQKAQEGGQQLIDTLETISMSLLLDTTSYAPYLALKNHNTGKTQTIPFTKKDFPGAIPLSDLDYSEPHKNGFHYQNKLLTLYLGDGRKIEIEVTI